MNLLTANLAYIADGFMNLSDSKINKMINNQHYSFLVLNNFRI